MGVEEVMYQNQEPRNIQIITDGEGTIIVFVGGKFAKTFYAEYMLPYDFADWFAPFLVAKHFPNEE